MYDWLAALILGIVEGVTEFLPVSSTGHLLIAEKFLTIKSSFLHSELFNIGIQGGAVLAVLLNFKDKVTGMARNWQQAETKDYILKLGAAFILTAVCGLVLKKAGVRLPETIGPVAWATLVGGVLFVGLERWLKGKNGAEQITWTIALAVGAAQLLAAVFPGTSRSGATILFALALGLNRPRAIEFSFLLGVPTLLAASAYSLLKQITKEGLGSVDWVLFAIGFIAATVTAFITVRWLLRFVQTHSFELFGWYRIALGIALLLFIR